MSLAKRFHTWLLTIGLTTLLVGCSGEPPLAEPPPVEVIISQPVKENITDWDTYTGTVEAKESVEVRARVRGHVKDVPFEEGEEIAAGTNLFVIDAEPFQADLVKYKGEMVAWEAKLKSAEKEVAIKTPLAEKGTVSKIELLDAEARKGDAIGGVETSRGKILEAELNISYCKINAPIAGKVGEAAVSKGDLVNATGNESLLTTIVAVDPMYVYFNVNQGAYQRYREQLIELAKKHPELSKGGKPKIPVELMVAGDTRNRYQGYVDFVDNRVDPGTSSIKVRAKFENAKGTDGRRPLTAGLFARVRVTLTEPTPAILVADRAILSDQSLKYVLVVNKEKKVERVDITPSNRVQESGLRAVEKGLKGDEWVIVDGVNRARPGVTVSPTESKMSRRPANGR